MLGDRLAGVVGAPFPAAAELSFTAGALLANLPICPARPAASSSAEVSFSSEPAEPSIEASIACQLSRKLLLPVVKVDSLAPFAPSLELCVAPDGEFPLSIPVRPSPMPVPGPKFRLALALGSSVAAPVMTKERADDVPNRRGAC
jgi:hypothetical protein